MAEATLSRIVGEPAQAPKKRVMRSRGPTPAKQDPAPAPKPLGWRTLAWVLADQVQEALDQFMTNDLIESHNLQSRLLHLADDTMDSLKALARHPGADKAAAQDFCYDAHAQITGIMELPSTPVTMRHGLAPFAERLWDDADIFDSVSKTPDDGVYPGGPSLPPPVDTHSDSPEPDEPEEAGQTEGEQQATKILNRLHFLSMSVSTLAQDIETAADSDDVQQISDRSNAISELGKMLGVLAAMARKALNDPDAGIMGTYEDLVGV